MTNFNRLSIINTILITIVFIAGLIYSFQYNTQVDAVYVDNIVLFNGFNMTKDIQAIEEAKIETQGKDLDSLYKKFQSLTDKDQNSAKALQLEIANRSKLFQELQDNYAHNLNKNVWNRLNNYIKEYAIKNNLKIVFGTRGNGNIMFAQESMDITNQILEFSNLKYEGNN